tara:strand:- start:815 stop:1117 length:303 start_codon:yes stop_codon:yes gene_type:complete
MTMHTFQQQLNESPCIPIFEIEVIDKAADADYIICEISVIGDQLVAQRDAVSKKEENSRYIAKSVIDIDSDCFSLDEHLQDLYAEVSNDILFGDLYDLAK